MHSSDAVWRNDPGAEHFFQRPEGDAVVRSVTDRLPAGEADHLRRLVRHPGAFGHRERERTIFPDKHLDAARVLVPFGKMQELGPSSG